MQNLPEETRQALEEVEIDLLSSQDDMWDELFSPEVHEVWGELQLTRRGLPANTIENCRKVFQLDPLLSGSIRLNLLTERVDIVKDLGWQRSTSAITDTDWK